MKKIFVLAGMIRLISFNSLKAQESNEKPKAPPGSAGSELLELAKASQNPVADMNTVPI